jgi:hypothetical protein
MSTDTSASRGIGWVIGQMLLLGAVAGSMLGEALKGRMSGLAVFNRALTEAEMKRLHDAAHLELLK